MRDSFSDERVGGPAPSPLRLFDLLRALLYLVLGGVLIYTANQPNSRASLLPLSPTFRMVLGGLAVLYGLVRLYRALPRKS